MPSVVYILTNPAMPGLVKIGDAAIALEFFPIAPAELGPRYAFVARRIHQIFAWFEIGHPNVVAAWFRRCPMQPVETLRAGRGVE